MRIILLITLFILPVVLLYFKIIPFRYRTYVLGLVAVIIATVVLVEGWGLGKLGLRLDEMNRTWLPYGVFTIISSGLLVVLAKILRRPTMKQWWRDSHFLYGFIILSALQEFCFRGFLIPELQKLFASAILVIVINAALFTFMHLIYAADAFLLSALFVSGLGFAAMYVSFPSLILIIISHAILNFIVVYFGVFTQQRQTPVAPSLRGN